MTVPYGTSCSILGMFAMLYVAFLTVYEHYKLDDATIAAMHNDHLPGVTTTTTTTLLSNSTTTTALSVAQTANSTTSPIGHGGQLKSTVNWVQSLVVVPVLCFAYQTHEVIVPVYACMKQRSIGHFMRASMFGLVILFLLYNLVGAYGYLTFGENVDPDIMSLYDAKDPVVVVGIVALVIKFITTYPPLMFCGRGALEGLYGEFRKQSAEEFKASEKGRRIVITTGWFFSTVALAIFAPDISVTLQLLGSMASVNVFVFPGMCLISLTRRLRLARQALLLDEAYDEDDGCQPNGNANGQQRAKDYYLISGSYFNAVRKNLQFRAKYQAINQQQQQLQQNNHHLHHHNHHHHHQHILSSGTLNSINEFSESGGRRSTFQASIAPSTVAQIGISRSVGLGLYIFSAMLILFGGFIFVLELVSVFGYL